MGFWSWTKGLFTGGNSEAAGTMLAGIFPSGQPPRRGTRELLQAYRTHPWLRAVAHRIARDVAAVPLVLYRPITARGMKQRRVMRYMTAPMRREALDIGVRAQDFEVVDSHPMLDFLFKLNPVLRRHGTLHITQVWSDLKGDGFWILERGANGMPIEAWPVPPHWCAETPSANNPRFRFSYNSWQRSVGEEDVVWFRHPDAENPYGRGSGVAEALADELDVDEYAARHLKSFFFNRALPDAFISIEGLSDRDEALRYEERLRQKHQGVGKGFQVHVTSGKVDVQQLGTSLKDQNILPLRQAQRDTVVQVFNVPPEVLGIIENTNRSTIDAASYLYMTGVVCPRVDVMVDTLQPLVESVDRSMVLGYLSPVPEDREFRRTVMAALPSCFTVDEHRFLAGAPPLPDGKGDQLFQPFPPPMLPAPAVDVPALPAGEAPEEVQEEPAAQEVEEEEDADATRGRSLQGSRVERSVEDVLKVLTPLRLLRSVSPVMQSELEEYGNAVLERLGFQGSFDMRSPLVADILELHAGTRVVEINDTTLAALREALVQGYMEGDGVDAMADRIAEVFDMADARAETIARTEVMGASNAGAVAAYKQSGVVSAKEWLSQKDGQTRPTHVAMDGQVVQVDSAFQSPSGHSAQSPGSFGIADEDINCRCTVLPVVDDPKASPQGEDRVMAWEKAMQQVSQWERRTLVAYRTAFKQQREDVLAAWRRESQ